MGPMTDAEMTVRNHLGIHSWKQKQFGPNGETPA
jgi:hypothetical protein